MKIALFGTFLCALFPACNGEESKPPGPVSPAEGEREGGEGEGQGEGEGEGPITGEGEGEGPVCDPATCADAFPCTEDRCADNQCVNVPAHARCGEGKICRPAEGGCVAPPPCRDNADCVTDDPCQVGACDGATRACTFTPFDGDEDGHAPIICGGDDCDDSKGRVRPGHPEDCNGQDDNCDGVVDEGFDLTTTEHCGSCDNHCPETTICQNSQCVCPEGTELCEGSCVLLTSPEHCGRCGNQCPEGAACENGECHCPLETEDCGGGHCVSITTPTNCGRCGNECEQDLVCRDLSCQCPNPGDEPCDGFCTSLADDPSNCGRCGNECRDGMVCRAGSCECPERLTFCPDIGCVDLEQDNNNCGACGNACPAFVFHRGAINCLSCVEGSCRCLFPEAEFDCQSCRNEHGEDAVCGDQCRCAVITSAATCDGQTCIDLNTDSENCGRCGNACAAGERCEEGGCVN